MERYFSWDRDIQHRIGWGFATYGDKQDTAARLRRVLEQNQQLQPDAQVLKLRIFLSPRRGSPMSAQANGLGFRRHGIQNPNGAALSLRLGRPSCRPASRR
jgi:hypothetical protein